MDEKRPRSREKNVTGSANVSKRGDGLGSGPVGSGNGHFNQTSGTSGKRATGKQSPIGVIIVLIICLLGGGTGMSGVLSSLLLGNSGVSNAIGNAVTSGITNSLTGGSSLNSLINGFSGSTFTSTGSNTGVLNTKVAAGSRDKRTTILGNNQDTITIMVYMCGTDLESRSGMATSDLQEMMNAKIGDNVNLLVYTGGCKAWKNNIISSSKNQIYQIQSGNMKCLEKDMGSVSMTKPETLTSFINYCTTNYPANRQMLIFWDHGGGSLSGYGYDEKYASSGSMKLAGINKALKDSNTTFDFIGFDACLMATLENALMLSPYGDYLIASEETEPGVGWYYTNWLTKLSNNTSMTTLEIGKNIIDDFVDVCAQKCPGQKTTLSILDLAELENTVPNAFTKFASSTNNLIANNNYKIVSDARYQTREFAQSSGIDQIDLTNFAMNINTKEATDFADILKDVVKYNRTSSNMSNAYGISICWPYRKTSNVNQAVATYDAIGLDDEYTRCIQSFARLESSGQIVTGSSNSNDPVAALLGSLTGGSSSNGSDVVSQLLTSFLKSNPNKSISDDAVISYVAANQFDTANLMWKENDGKHVIQMPEEQWQLVQNIVLNMFYDDGTGYIDLGLDNVFDFDDNGNMIGDTDKSWLAINGQPVAYYYMDTLDDGDHYTITGYVPAFLNNERVQLLLTFDDQNPYGYISGVRKVYDNKETDTLAKDYLELNVGDKLDFICDYYDYNGTYQDSYLLGEQMTVTEKMEISNVVLTGGELLTTYRFTDIYNQTYWTPVIR